MFKKSMTMKEILELIELMDGSCLMNCGMKLTMKLKHILAL